MDRVSAYNGRRYKRFAFDEAVWSQTHGLDSQTATSGTVLTRIDILSWASMMISKQRRYCKAGSGGEQKIVRLRETVQTTELSFATIYLTELDHLTLLQLYRGLIDLEGTGTQLSGGVRRVLLHVHLEDRVSQAILLAH